MNTSTVDSPASATCTYNSYMYMYVCSTDLAWGVTVHLSFNENNNSQLPTCPNRYEEVHVG